MQSSTAISTPPNCVLRHGALGHCLGDGRGVDENIVLNVRAAGDLVDGDANVTYGDALSFIS
jgi:hypothetical protein